MSIIGNTIQNTFNSTVNSFKDDINRKLTVASMGTFGLTNFSTITDMVQQSAREAINNRTLANFKVDKEHDNASIASPQNFLNAMNDGGGYIRPNRYLVEFNSPVGLSEFITKIKMLDVAINDSQRKEYDMNKIGLLCHSVSIPQKSFQTYEHKQLSVAYKVPHSLTFDPITFTFYCDGDMEVRRFFDAWMRLIINDDNATLNFYDDFIADVRISILDVSGNIRYMILLKEAFPLTLSNIDLSYTSNNNLLSMSVTLSYKTWNEIYEE